VRTFASLLLDAYRHLNARKLFWVTLAISLLVVIAYGGVGFEADGVNLFYGLWSIESRLLNEGSELSVLLYRAIFSSFMVTIWLAWAATILALISTASIFPDFLSGGAIDLVLSKPIGRFKLFFFKYVTSLLFVLLQVAIFCFGVFLCMGLRIGDWDPKVFLAIPIVTLFFSYLYAVCVTVGVLTRSTLAALLLTMLFWVGLFSINSADSIMRNVLIMEEVRLEQQNEMVVKAREELRTLEPDQGERRERLESRIDETMEPILAESELHQRMGPWLTGVSAVQWVLPKTGLTISLLDRAMVRESDASLQDLLQGNVEVGDDGGYEVGDRRADEEAAIRLADHYASMPIWQIIGTSLVFELFILAIGAWRFSRQDF